MARQESIATRLIAAMAERLSKDHRIPDENREAFRQHAAVLIEQHLCDAFGGERLRMWLPSKPRAEAAAQRERILQAVADGEPAKVIARRELVSEQWVRKLRRLLEAKQTGP